MKNSKNKTKEDIREAFETLTRAGKKPTIDNIRDAMGGGSDSTIVKYLKQLHEEARQSALAADPFEPPNETKLKAAELIEPLVKCVFLAGLGRGQQEVATQQEYIATLELDRDALILGNAELSEKLHEIEKSVGSIRDAWHAEVAQERLRVDAARNELSAMRLELLENQKQYANHVSCLEDNLKAAKSEINDRDVTLARLNGRLEGFTKPIVESPVAAAA